jgi:hypothetical protein
MERRVKEKRKEEKGKGGIVKTLYSLWIHCFGAGNPERRIGDNTITQFFQGQGQ